MWGRCVSKQNLPSLFNAKPPPIGSNSHQTGPTPTESDVQTLAHFNQADSVSPTVSEDSHLNQALLGQFGISIWA